MIIYGKSGASFAKDLYFDPTGKDPNKEKEWKKAKAKGVKLVEDYLNTFSGLKKWITDTQQFARDNQYVKSLFGFYRRLPQIRSSNNKFRSGAERQAINAPIQGSGAFFTLLSLIDIQKMFKEYGLVSKVVATVHDSICIDTYIPEIPQVCRIVKDCMEKAHTKRIDTPVPIRADGEMGDCYGRVFEIDIEESDKIDTKEKFDHWLHDKLINKYKGEIDTLKKKNFTKDEVSKWLKEHNRVYPELDTYLAEQY